MKKTAGQLGAVQNQNKVCGQLARTARWQGGCAMIKSYITINSNDDDRQSLFIPIKVHLSLSTLTWAIINFKIR